MTGSRSRSEAGVGMKNVSLSPADALSDRRFPDADARYQSP